ncbi:MAG: peptidoglycan D,D-transpeptidase FtsI family protein [Candidatus Limnocylindrales bacterium]
MAGRTDRRPRLLFLAAVLIVSALTIGARLAYWQVVRGAELRDLAASQLSQSVTMPVERGSIYDRTGTVVLATVAYRDRLAAYPGQIPGGRRAAVAGELARILELDAAGIVRLDAALAGDAQYVVLAGQLTSAQSDAVRAGLESGDLVGLDLEPLPLRVYPAVGGAPDTTLASQLLGFTNHDGQGQYGIEQRYQAILAGRPRQVIAPLDVSGRPVTQAEQVVDAGAPGVDLRLTIDAGLQLQLERELYAAWVADKAKTVSAVVLDPHSGAVLAWASVPGYDANAYGAVASDDPRRFIDPIASTIYEPGSVMKMFVAAAAFEGGVVNEHTLINDSGSLKFGQYTVYDWDRKALGRIPFEEGIARSRNIVAAQVARRLGSDTSAAARVLFDMWQRLGIGQPTGVDTSGEVAGIVVDPAKVRWADVDLANRSFGQGMAVTQLQLAASYAAMVNGGFRVEPHVVAAIGGQDVPAATPKSVIGAALSKELTRLLVHVVTSVPQYARDTLMRGYLVGGKSGTAQIWDTKTNDWAADLYNFSFVGFVGQDAPDAVIAVRIGDARPLNEINFNMPVTSQALFRRIAVDTVAALGIRPAPVIDRGAVGP